MDQLTLIASIASILGFAVALIVIIRPVQRWLQQVGGPAKGTARAAVAIVYRGADVLMVRRRGTAEKLTWQFPAGTMNGEEEPALRAIEEVKDETGVSCKFDKRLGSRLHPDTHVFCYYLACTYESGEPKNRDPEENSEAKWVPAEDVARLVTTDLHRPVLKFLKELAGR